MQTLSKDGSSHVTDERFNTASHLAAAALSLLGTAYLIVMASVQAKPWHIVGFSIYGLTLTGLFISSVLHHGIEAGEKTNRTLRSLDYAMIFLLIAGTYTPILLVLFRSPLGWTVFGSVWAIALSSAILRVVRPSIPGHLTTTLYVLLGWFALALIPEMSGVLPFSGIAYLAGGGVLYTLGGVVFALEKPNPWPGCFGFHEIWHLFVMGGAACHFAFMLLFVLPAP